jgi:hypothetical protein
MLKRPVFLTLAIVLLFSLLVSGCGGSQSGNSAKSSAVTPAPPRGITGTITVGKIAAAVSLKIPTGGGAISVTDAESPIKSLEITIPAGSYPETKEFKISSAPVEKHTFGEGCKPITPMIIVENGGDYAGQDMPVTIPVSIPEGNFAMGFFYHENTRTLEGMPLIAESPTSITLATRHFSNFIISMIPFVQLKKDIDTHFRPGIDDWQFVNKGSFISPRGHCAGQSVSAMWYYCKQPDGQDLTLYGRYDNNGNKPATPDFQLDDSLGYRLASVVQTDMDWDNWANKFFTDQRGVNDELAWYLFAYSMQFSEQPQYITMDSNSIGHAMICYRIKDGHLYVADPNYPGDTGRRIEYISGKFKPYQSGANREEIEQGNSISFNKIGYAAQSARVDWNKMSRRWTEFKNGTIGNDKFPAYKIESFDDKGVQHELIDGYVSPREKLSLFATGGPGGNGAQEMVYRDGQELKDDGRDYYTLFPGVNKLGIYIYSDPPFSNKRYIDFQYINVTYSGLAIDPPSQEGPPNQYLTYKAIMDKMPDKARLEWYVDGVLKQSSSTLTTFKVYFDKPGSYTISLKLVDAPEGDPSGKVVQEAKATATIKLPSPSPTAAVDYLAILQGMNNLKGGFGGNGNYKSWSILNWDLTPAGPGESTKKRTEVYSFPWYGMVPNDGPMKITWNGASFSGSLAYKVNTVEAYEEIKATVSADGKMLTSFKHTYTYKSADPAMNVASERVHTLIVQNIPIPYPSGSSINIQKSGADLQKSITTCEYRLTDFKNGEKMSELTLISPDWSDNLNIGKPTLNLQFSK